MKKVFLALSMIVVLGLVANVALTDVERVYFPFWQYGWGLDTFFSVSNSAEAQNDAEVTIVLLQDDGTLVDSTTNTIAPGTAWLPSTMDEWYEGGDEKIGFGYFDVEAEGDFVYLWGCIFADLTGQNLGQPGYTLVLPQNPYGGNPTIPTTP